MHPLSSAAASGFGVSLAAAMGGRPRTPKRNVGAFPALDSVAHIDAINNRYWVRGEGFVPATRLFRRNSLAWAQDETGVLRQYGVNEPRRVPAPDGVMALLREPASTNLVPNNTNGVWSKSAQVAGGLVWSVVGTGIEDGYPYTDLRLSGTNSTAGISYQSVTFATTGAGSPVGTYFTVSARMRVIAGSFANLMGAGTEGLRWSEAGGVTASYYGTNIPTGILAATSLKDAAAFVSRTATTAWSDDTTMQCALQFPVNVGNTADVTLRVAAIQWEQQAFPTSPIITTGVALTRDRDGIFIPMDTPLGAVGAQSQYMDCLVPYTRNDWNRLTSGSSVALALSATGGTPAFAEVWNGSVAPSTSNLVAFGSRAKVGYAGDGASRSICLNGGPVKTDPSAVVSPQASWVGLGTGVLLGQLSDGSDAQAPICYVHEFIAANRRWADDRLVGMTR